MWLLALAILTHKQFMYLLPLLYKLVPQVQLMYPMASYLAAIR